MKATVTIDDDTTVTVDLSPQSMTLQEECDVEEQLGYDRYKLWLDERVMTPQVWRALIWAKLRGAGHDIDVRSFNLDGLDGGADDAPLGDDEN